jgi:hypothetical protein
LFGVEPDHSGLRYHADTLVPALSDPGKSGAVGSTVPRERESAVWDERWVRRWPGTEHLDSRIVAVEGSVVGRYSSLGT